MAGALGEVHVRGQAELERAFMEVRRDVTKELRPALAAAAEPARSEAEGLIIEGVRNIGPKWSRFRIGVTPRSVYLAPKMRRHGGSPRPNLALGLAIAAQRAVDDKQEEIEAAVTAVVDSAVARNGFR